MVSFHGFVQKLTLKDANTVSSLPKAPTLTVHTQIHTYTAQFHESLHKHAYTYMGPRVPAHCSMLFFSSKPLLSWVLWSSLALGDSQSHASVSCLTLGSPPKTAPLQIAKKALCFPEIFPISGPGPPLSLLLSSTRLWVLIPYTVKSRLQLVPSPAHFYSEIR